MPAAGSSTSSSLRVLGEEHADLEPLLLAVREGAGLGVGLAGEADGLEDLVDAVALRRCDAVRKGVANTPRLPSSESRMFSKTV